MAIFLLIVLLLNILTERQVSRSEKPVLITLIDNSSSLKNYADSNTVLKNISEFRSDLDEQFSNRFDIKTFLLSDSIAEGEMDLKGAQTNLNAGFDYIFNQFYNRNIGGIVLISDGNYNAGIDPVYTAEKIKLTPVFSLGVGDTILKRDQLIRTVNANSVAFLDNDFPVEVTIEAKKLKGKLSKLSIYKKGKLLQSQELAYNDEHSFVTATFLLKADTPGFNNYELKLDVADSERNTDNNFARFYIEVIDTRSKVLILADAPHPDVAALRSVVESNDRVEVSSFTIDKFDGKLEDVELVLFHGLHSSKSIELNRQLIKMKIPAWYFYTSETGGSIMNEILGGATVPGGARFDAVQSYENPSFMLFDHVESLSDMLNGAPPIQVRFGDFKGNFGDVWLKQRLGNVRKESPVLSFKTINGRKCGFFLGEGLWRWKLSEYNRKGHNEGFNELVQRSIQYLTVKKNSEPLRIYLPDKFNSDKEIEIRAEFYNESLEPITTPEIDMDLTSDSGKKFSYRFSRRSADYFVNIGKMNPGLYNFRVHTKYNGKAYEKTGVFVIEEMTMEALNTHSDFGLLRKLGAKTGGSFYQLKDYKRLINEIGSREDIVTVNYTESKFSNLIDLVWLLITVLLLLSTEWFIRRYSGSY